VTARSPAWLVDVPFAHRGLHDHRIPENSLAAVAAAADADYGVELDVQLTADGYPVVLHDVTLERVAGAPLRPGELPLAELAQLRLGGGDHRVPTLADALDVVGGRTPVMVELKNFGRRTGRLEGRAAAVLDSYAGPFCVSSFNPRTITWLRRTRPGWLRGQAAGTLEGVPMPTWLRPLLRRMAWNRRNRPDFVAYELAALPHPAVDRARRSGAAVVAWTVTSQDELMLAQRLSDNIIFEGVRP